MFPSLFYLPLNFLQQCLQQQYATMHINTTPIARLPPTAANPILSFLESVVMGENVTIMDYSSQPKTMK